jgi:hypothetical protein
MADVKISGLPASTTPLAGTEVLPIVQGGVTKQVSVANLTAGRAVAALSVTTDTYKAASSSGGALQNASGVAQVQWGAGGGSNFAIDVAANINPANAQVDISPTGTGTVRINPATASTMNNVVIGGTTPLVGNFTTVTATTKLLVGTTTDPGIANQASAFSTNYWKYGASTTGSSIFWVLNASNTGVSLTDGNTSWAAQSDERTKDIIEPIGDALNKINSLRAVIGKYKTDKEGARRSFLIAQDVQKVLPEVVDTDTDEQGTLSIRYTEVIPLLVASIKELSSQVAELQAKLKSA